ncbi:unnamed protein product [Gordionus sp. m RMFG-2023]
MEDLSKNKSNFYTDEQSSHDVWLKSSPNLEANFLSYLDMNIDDEISDPLKICFGFTHKEKIEILIENCKKLLKSTVKGTKEYNDLVFKIIQMKMKLLQISENETQAIHKDNYHINGHNFVLQQKYTKERICEQCNNVIIPFFHHYLQCKNCNYICHLKCTSLLQTNCVKNIVKTRPSYTITIRPETGLYSQYFKCADCKTIFDLDKPTLNLNICDYSGAVFCDSCFRNDTMPIPARILHNWDFKPRGVSKKSKHFLELMRFKPVVSLIDLNSSLFTKVSTLQRLSVLRKNLLYIKIYLTTCKRAIKEKLLLKISNRQHFVENSDMYSIQDLIDLNNDVLLPELSLIYNSYIIHIKQNCEVK